MVHDKSDTGGRDWAAVSGSEGYEVDFFARKHGLTHE